MGQVVPLFDGFLAPIGCVSVRRPEICSQSAVCRFRRVLLEIRDLTARYMANATLASVYANDPVTPQEVLSLKMVDGDGI